MFVCHAFFRTDGIDCLRGRWEVPLRMLRFTVIVVRTIECCRDALRPALGNGNAVGGLGNAAHGGAYDRNRSEDAKK